MKERYTAPLEFAVSKLSSPTVLDSNLTNLRKETSSRARKYAKHILPGWSAALKSAHLDLELTFCRWKSAGKPQSPTNTNQRSAYLENCSAHHQSIKEDYLLNFNKDSKKLFRDIKRFYGSSSSSSPGRIVFRGTSYSGDTLLDGWANYFESLGTPGHSRLFDNRNNDKVMGSFRALLETSRGGNIVFTPLDIATATRETRPQALNQNTYVSLDP